MNDKAQKLINAIKVPASLNERQVMLVKSFAKSKMMDGFTVGSFCRENNLSTATWYSYLENDDFKAYLNDVSNSIVPADEKEAYSKIKKKIMQIAEKENPSIKEIELFTNTFAYVIEADKKERIEALGLSDESIKTGGFKTVDEHKAILLSRLKGNDMK